MAERPRSILQGVLSIGLLAAASCGPTVPGPDDNDGPSQAGATPEAHQPPLHIVVALKETMRLTGEIDEAIEAHGGWPIT